MPGLQRRVPRSVALTTINTVTTTWRVVRPRWAGFVAGGVRGQIRRERGEKRERGYVRFYASLEAASRQSFAYIAALFQ